jgi:hypothetical protein
MHLLLTDETNVTPSETVDFFVTGGLFFPIARLSDLHSGIDAIRRVHGYKAGDTLKFNTHERPSHISQAACTSAKSAVMDLCLDLGCRFIGYVILHSIIDKENQILWGLDAVIRSFDLFLREANEDGIVIFDRVPVTNVSEYLASKFFNGLEFPKEKARVDLSRIKLFASTCINASHANTAMDVVLGSFRYAINRPANEAVAKSLMGRTARLMWGERKGEALDILDKGLVLRPVVDNIKVPDYKKKYDDLLDHINRLIADAKPSKS